jgi:multiple sugar transport system permease protein
MEAAAGQVRVGRLGWRSRGDERRLLAPALIAPAIVFILALVGGPLLLSIYLSFTDATAGSLGGHFIGLQNFGREWSDPIFRRAVLNTFIFVFASQAIVLVAAGVLANFLMRNFPGKWFLRFLILLPWAAPIALGAIGWKWIFDSLYSVINWTLAALHLVNPVSPPNWLGEPTLAIASIIAVHAWRLLPFATIIMLFGLSSIPSEIEDAAALDGATGLRKSFWITIPLVLPVATIAVLFGIVFTATDMAVVYILTNGGPFNSTQMLTMWSFQTGIVSASLGSGAAISLFLFPVLLVVSLLMLVVARRAEVT